MTKRQLRSLKSDLWLLRIITTSSIITGAIATMALAESTMPMSVQLIVCANLLLSVGGLVKSQMIKEDIADIEAANQD